MKGLNENSDENCYRKINAMNLAVINRSICFCCFQINIIPVLLIRSMKTVLICNLVILELRIKIARFSKANYIPFP